MTAEVSQMLRHAAASGTADAILRAGAAALQAGSYAEAVEPVRNALRHHGANARLWHLLGLIHRNLDDLEPSVKAFAKAAELAPEDAMIAHAHACVRYEAGLPAVSHFERARRFAPSDRSILLQHSAAMVAEGRSEAAIVAIDEELARNPLWLKGHAALARLRWSYGDHDNFVSSFDRAVLQAPNDIGLWRAYIDELIKANLFEAALDVVERARSAAGDHPTFDSTEAISQSELGQSEAADALFQRLGVIDSSLIAHRLRFLLRAGRIDEAVRYGEQHVSGDSTNQVMPYLSLAWRLTGNPRWEWLEGDPRFVGVYDIADRLPPLDALAQRLRTIHRTVRQPFDQSLRGGTQTEDHLLPRIEPEIRALRRAIVETVREHIDQLPPPQPGHPLLVEKRSPIGFAGSWSVRLTGGGRHINHVHPSGWISSALYVALPDERELGGDDKAGWLTLGEATELGLDLPPIRTIEPRPGRLVLFPSTMWHGTRPFEAGERLTVAFDVKLSG